jgi:hypothetical protein
VSDDRPDVVPYVLTDLDDVDGVPTEGAGLTYRGGVWAPTPGYAEVTYYNTSPGITLANGNNIGLGQNMVATNYENEGVFTNTAENPAPLTTGDSKVNCPMIDASGWYSLFFDFLFENLYDGDHIYVDQNTGYDTDLTKSLTYVGALGNQRITMVSGLIYITAGETLDGFYRYYLAPTCTVKLSSARTNQPAPIVDFMSTNVQRLSLG